ncbi:MAG: hypothetical protein ACYC1P_09305 [Gaiellaceae bacterium]
MRAVIGLRSRRTVVAGVAIFAIAGGIAFASIPDADGLIHGCYRSAAGDAQGQLRVVEDPARCRGNETAIQWSEQGVAGAPGPQGPPGEDGEDGTFSGTFTSPNGQYSLSVTDAGIVLASPDSSIRVTDSAIRVETMGPDLIELRGANQVKVESGAAFELRAGSTASLQSGGGFAVRGSSVDINGVGCRPAARAGDAVAGGSIASGSTTVCIG